MTNFTKKQQAKSEIAIGKARVNMAHKEGDAKLLKTAAKNIIDGQRRLKEAQTTDSNND